MEGTRAFRSKIGRLSFKLRNELCERIRDGATGDSILLWLNATPEWRRAKPDFGGKDVNSQNLSEWRQTGYKDWLRNQGDADQMRKMTESALAMVNAAGGDPSTVAARVAAARLIQTLEEVTDPDLLNKRATAISNLQKSEIAGQRLALSRETLDLERQKFMRQSCELFLKWHADQTATSIAAGPGTNKQKVDRLLEYMRREEQSSASSISPTSSPATGGSP